MNAWYRRRDLTSNLVGILKLLYSPTLFKKYLKLTAIKNSTAICRSRNHDWSMPSSSIILERRQAYLGIVGNAHQNNPDGWKALQVRGKICIFDFEVNCNSFITTGHGHMSVNCIKMVWMRLRVAAYNTHCRAKRWFSLIVVFIEFSCAYNFLS